MMHSKFTSPSFSPTLEQNCTAPITQRAEAPAPSSKDEVSTVEVRRVSLISRLYGLAANENLLWFRAVLPMGCILFGWALGKLLGTTQWQAALAAVGTIILANGVVGLIRSANAKKSADAKRQQLMTLEQRDAGMNALLAALGNGETVSDGTVQRMVQDVRIELAGRDAPATLESPVAPQDSEEDVLTVRGSDLQAALARAAGGN